MHRTDWKKHFVLYYSDINLKDMNNINYKLVKKLFC